MMTASLHLDDPSVDLHCREVAGVERLGEPARHELLLFSPEPVEAASVLRKRCALRLASALGERWIQGVVTRFSRLLTAQPEPGRRYRAVVEPSWALLRLRRLSRVYQRVTGPDLVKEVLVRAGFPAERVEMRLAEVHPERRYVVQWEEDDLGFIRRICEEEGLYFRALADDDGERFLLEDGSPFAPSTLEGPIAIGEAAGLLAPALVAWSPRARSERRAGKVTLRDHDPDRPALDLTASASAGAGTEQATEVYLAPGRFLDPKAGEARARRHLESLRADARTIRFETNAARLAPGDAFSLEHGPDSAGSPAIEGEHVATAVHFRWSGATGEGSIAVEAIPREVPFRLPRVTPRPRIEGVQPALVTGPPGAEIHPDPAGRIFVRFLWDREGPNHEGSSLPVRVVQPNLPGSMVLPRVGWEVAVAFEDGDPDRPYVLGRVYNGKTPPPFPLPANKTVTSLRSFSSPGGGAHNTIHFDDAAGRQHLSIHAGFGKTTTVGNDLVVQTAKVEQLAVHGSQSATIGAKDALSVKEALIVQVGSQCATVGASQDLFVKGDLNVHTGLESVSIGGALLEKVGDPVAGALNLGVNAALASAGARGQRLGPVGQAMTQVATTAAAIGWDMAKAASAPGAGPNAGRDAGIRGLIGAAAGLTPGGAALAASIMGHGRTFPWEPDPAESGATAAGGGASGATGDAAVAGGLESGHRNEIVKGPYAEVIGGANVVLTPGEVKWQTHGDSTVIVGGLHATKAPKQDVKVVLGSTETLGSLHLKAATSIGRKVTGAITTHVAGALKIKAGGAYLMKAGLKVSLKVGGPLKCEGGRVAFVVGGSVVEVSPGGVLIKASTIKINGATRQSRDTTH